MDAESHELIAGYALDALDDVDLARAKELLATSEEAREELRSLTEVAAAMATAAAGPAPRPELRNRILEAARAEPQTVVSLDAHRRSRTAPVLGAVAALAACAALALGLWGVSAARDRDDARAALDRQQAIAAVLADPDARSIELQEGDGRLVVDGEGDAVLVVNGLGPAPEGQTYELWVSEHGGAPVPAGLFDGGDTRAVVPVEQSVEPGSVVLVTVEEAGGVDAPTSDPIVASQPA
jgi:anti-sigma-K factor RskA